MHGSGSNAYKLGHPMETSCCSCFYGHMLRGDAVVARCGSEARRETAAEPTKTCQTPVRVHEVPN
jgi:hypothetical protein